MPSISTKGQQMPSSPIRKLVPFAEEAKRKGRKVYHLNIGQPDIKTPEVAREAVKNMSEKVIEYSHSAGHESYRRKLAAFYQGIGIQAGQASGSIVVYLMRCRTNVELAERTDGCLRISDCRNSV